MPYDCTTTERPCPHERSLRASGWDARLISLIGTILPVSGLCRAWGFALEFQGSESAQSSNSIISKLSTKASKHKLDATTNGSSKFPANVVLHTRPLRPPEIASARLAWAKSLRVALERTVHYALHAILASAHQFVRPPLLLACYDGLHQHRQVRSRTVRFACVRH